MKQRIHHVARVMIGLFALSAGACAPAQVGASATAPGAGAPLTASGGGATEAEAVPLVQRAAAVEGLVIDDQPRWFKVTLAADESLDLAYYTQTNRQHGVNGHIAVVDAMGGVRGETMTSTYEQVNWTPTDWSYKAAAAGDYLVRVSCKHSCGGGNVMRFRLSRK